MSTAVASLGRLQVLGTPVFLPGQMKPLGVVTQIWVDPAQLQVAALGIRRSQSEPGEEQDVVVPYTEMTWRGGKYALSAKAVIDGEKEPKEGWTAIAGQKLETAAGVSLGKVKGFEFDAATGALTQVMLSSAGVPLLPGVIASTTSLAGDQLVAGEVISAVEGAEAKVTLLQQGLLERFGLVQLAGVESQTPVGAPIEIKAAPEVTAEESKDLDEVVAEPIEEAKSGAEEPAALEETGIEESATEDPAAEDEPELIDEATAAATIASLEAAASTAEAEFAAEVALEAAEVALGVAEVVLEAAAEGGFDDIEEDEDEGIEVDAVEEIVIADDLPTDAIDPPSLESVEEQAAEEPAVVDEPVVVEEPASVVAELEPITEPEREIDDTDELEATASEPDVVAELEEDAEPEKDAVLEAVAEQLEDPETVAEMDVDIASDQGDGIEDLDGTNAITEEPESSEELEAVSEDSESPESPLEEVSEEPDPYLPRETTETQASTGNPILDLVTEWTSKVEVPEVLSTAASTAQDLLEKSGLKEILGLDKGTSEGQDGDELSPVVAIADRVKEFVDSLWVKEESSGVTSTEAGENSDALEEAVETDGLAEETEGVEEDAAVIEETVHAESRTEAADVVEEEAAEAIEDEVEAEDATSVEEPEEVAVETVVSEILESPEEETEEALESTDEESELSEDAVASLEETVEQIPETEVEEPESIELESSDSEILVEKPEEVQDNNPVIALNASDSEDSIPQEDETIVLEVDTVVSESSEAEEEPAVPPENLPTSSKELLVEEPEPPVSEETTPEVSAKTTVTTAPKWPEFPKPVQPPTAQSVAYKSMPQTRITLPQTRTTLPTSTPKMPSSPKSF